MPVQFLEDKRSLTRWEEFQAKGTAGAKHNASREHQAFQYG